MPDLPDKILSDRVQRTCVEFNSPVNRQNISLSNISTDVNPTVTGAPAVPGTPAVTGTPTVTSTLTLTGSSAVPGLPSLLTSFYFNLQNKVLKN